MRLLVSFIVALSTVLCAPYNGASILAIAQPSSPESAVPSDDGAVFGPGASWGGPPTRIPSDGAETLTAQTGALGNLVQTAIIQHRSLSHEAVEQALHADINTSLGLDSPATAALPQSMLSLERQSVATIIPGHALGPVTVGMSATDADAAAARFARTTGRVIDVLFRNGVVVAAGSALTMSIDVQLPDDNKSFLPRDAIGGQSTLDINGSPDQLVNAFGAPRVVREGRDNLAQIFGAGLVAYIQRTQARGAAVSYLAVQATGSTAVPTIGNFAQWSEGPTGGIVVTYLPIQSMGPVPVSSIGHVAPRSGESSETVIVPGSSIGPVGLGMPIRMARETAARFEHQTGCNIDLLAARDVVIAAGSPWGGCLSLQVPRQSAAHGIGDPPALLAEVFGRPQIMHLGGDREALIFDNGLAAHIGVLRFHGGFVTYLAVQPRSSRSVPQIGHFNSDGGSGSGLLPPPPSH